MSLFKHPFYPGWKMIGIASIIPLLFSAMLGVTFVGVNETTVSIGISFRTNFDFSHIFSYFSFGLLHIIICIGITYYVYDVLRNSASIYVFKSYKKQHFAAFLIVSVSFIAIVYFFDTPLEFLSNNILWIGLEKLSPSYFLFKNFKIIGSIEVKPFDLMPISLVIAAFLPASAIMLAIPHLVEKVKISDEKEPSEIISDFLNEFETLYYLMVGMLLSSGIATHFYLKTPFTTIDPKKSESFANTLNSTFSMWSMVYFLVLLLVLFSAYGLVSKKVRLASSSTSILVTAHKFKEVRTAINLHFMIKKKSTLFASAFTPIFMMAIKQAFN